VHGRSTAGSAGQALPGGESRLALVARAAAGRPSLPPPPSRTVSDASPPASSTASRSAARRRARHAPRMSASVAPFALSRRLQ